jgi:antitoxin (DNA-binding transcriptional repressor) of toxin-antitoxin stability system
MKIIDIKKQKIELSEIIEIALQEKEEITLTQHNQKLVKITPLTEQKPKFPAKAGSAKGKIWIAEDFDAPLAEFEEYM